MAEFRRLISYIYEYEGNIKGKNVGFVKLEARNGMCRLSVSVKKLYMGSSDMGVYLLTGRQEIFLGNLFLRNGCGEFRTVVQLTNVQESGETMDECYGLTLHGKSETWRVYTTIWEDAVAQAAQLTFENATSENVVEREVERGRLSTVVPEILTRDMDMAGEKDAEEKKGDVPLSRVPQNDVPGPDTPAVDIPGPMVLEIERPSPGVPETERPSPGVPETGMPSPGAPETGTPSPGVPETGTPSPGVPETEMPGPGAAEGEMSGPRTAEGSASQVGVQGSGRPTIDVPGPGAAKKETAEKRATEMKGLTIPGFLGIVKPERSTPEQAARSRVVEFRGKSAHVPGTSELPKKEAPEPKVSLPDHEMGRLEMETAYPDIPLEKAVASGLFTAPASEEDTDHLTGGVSGRPAGQSRTDRPSGPAGSPSARSAGRSAQAEERPPMVIRQYEEEPLIIGDPQALARLDEQEAEEKLVPVWDFFADTYPKIQAFDSEHGCQVLVIKPQDIGLLPREVWIYGNNSFLLHGYYNYRYLILARLEDPRGLPRYLLGVPGHYYSNEKYMASMFGFPHFVLSKRQPSQDGRFGYWYTDIRMEENAVLAAAAMEKVRKMAY